MFVFTTDCEDGGFNNVYNFPNNVFNSSPDSFFILKSKQNKHLIILNSNYLSPYSV